MSIFPEKPDYYMPLEIARKIFLHESMIDFTIGEELLNTEELSSMFKAISFDPNSLGGIYPRKILNQDLVIIFSEKEVYYEGPNHIVKLGEYKMANPEYDGRETIELFVKSIRNTSMTHGLPADVILVSVFIHELYHAYFHKSNPVREVEEPLAELGSLLFMNAWLHNNDALFKGVYDFIRKKKELPEISFYGLGADLFCSFNEPNDYTVYLDSPQLISAYRTKRVERQNKEVMEYVERFPILFACEDKDDTRQLLLFILGCKSK